MDPARLARVAGALLALSVAAISADVRAQGSSVVLAADRDDDDGDGRADGVQPALPIAARRDVVSFERSWKKASFRAMSGADHVRLWDGARLLAWGKSSSDVPSIQGVTPGMTELEVTLASGKVSKETVEIWGLELRDSAGKVIDAATDHVALSRTPPSRDPGADPNAVKVLVTAPDPSRAPPELTVESLSAAGVRLDALDHVSLAATVCASGTCFESLPLRLVVDDVERSHPLALGHALRAEIGGGIVLRALGRKQVVRVLGPRDTPLGPIARLKATVRPFVLRITPGGAPSVGGSDAAAAATVRGDLAVASALWGQCGISLGDTSSIDVRIVDPPPPHLLAIGDGTGLPASGGEVRFSIDGKPITTSVATGASIDRVSRDVAAAVVRAGFVAVVSPNARPSSAAYGSVDVSVRRAGGALASLDQAHGAPLSTDKTLSVRIGSVELPAGLEHFTDDDSPTGTLEERTLVKALDDGDPSTVEIIIVPFFAGTGRIGESFIASESASMRDVVILDRGGIRARRTSFTLAHELGHVLMAMPGHPDDYGEDTPTLLLDSDASDSTPFGPKRISIAECVRAIRESGPKGRVPLLQAWPVAPLLVR